MDIHDNSAAAADKEPVATFPLRVTYYARVSSDS